MILRAGGDNVSVSGSVAQAFGQPVE